MAGREYRMRKRAEGFDATRERIVEAAAALHYRQGVAATSYVQIAEQAGVGPATVYRHFPTLGSLVSACGANVWDAIRPPVPENAPAVFAGLAARVQDVADTYSDKYDGLLTARVTGQQNEVDVLGTQVERWDVRLAQRKASLERTYAQLEVVAPAELRELFAR